MVAKYLWDHGSDIFADISQEMASYERYFCDEKQEHSVCNIITLHMSVINCDKMKNPNKNSTWIRIVWHPPLKRRDVKQEIDCEKIEVQKCSKVRMCDKYIHL